MPHHFPKNTVEATVWCAQCYKETPHRIDDGRRGPCLTCLARPTPKSATPATAAAPTRETSGDLFPKLCVACGQPRTLETHQVEAHTNVLVCPRPHEDLAPDHTEAL